MGACSLPGVSIVYDRFMPMLWRAVARGFVKLEHAQFVAAGLWHGFDCGIDVSLLQGKRRFLNYKSALEARPKVSKATRVRVQKGKTLMLCQVAKDYCVRSLAKIIPYPHWRLFSIAAVPKPLEPLEARPVSDHTKSGLKAATTDPRLRHTITAMEEIPRELKFAFSMIVGDVDAAYPLLPLAWWVWPFFMFAWFDVREVDESTSMSMFLYMHVCGDFGTSGFPGTFKIFFTDVVVNMARSESVLTLPMPVFVDDMALIGPITAHLVREWDRFKAFLKSIGVPMKELKERRASVRQLMLGFWWDSIARTRTLESRKLTQYLEMFSDFARRKTLSLTEMQSCAGRMQRAVMTLPQGAACMLASIYSLMAGLTLGFQKRRTTRVFREDVQGIHDLLHVNMGRGFFAWDRFSRAPQVWTDASKSSKYAGGGYVSACGAYRWWVYGGSAKRKPIDFLEGDAVILAAEDLGPGWYRCVVPIHLDNSSFQRSAVKGWSHADRLHGLLRMLFALSLKYECVFEFHWLSTHVNVHADALSRPDGETWFLEHVYEDGIWLPGPARRHPDSGKVRCLGSEFSADKAGDGPRRTAPEFVMAVSFPRASVHEGLPTDLVEGVQEFLSERLKPSSQRTVNAAVSHWRRVVQLYGWNDVILSDDPHRGGKLAAFVMHMARNTDLGSSSISNYVWGLRTFVKSKQQVDPLFGVYDWNDFMTSVMVKTWTVGEPRRAVPIALLRRALAAIDLSEFWEVQMGLFICLYLFGFSRSEHPCPKTYDGFDPTQHAMVDDVKIMTWRGAPCVALRLKVIKQDPRMERPEAAGNEDWVYIGNVEDAQFSIFTWLQRVFAMHGGPRASESPFFVAPDRARCLTYGTAMKQFRALLARVSDVDTSMLYGLHSLRVSGWNGARSGPEGEEVAVAHGGWHGSSQRRYDRFDRDAVLGLPAVILAADERHFDDTPVPGVAETRAPVPTSETALSSPTARKRKAEGTASSPTRRPRLADSSTAGASSTAVLPYVAPLERPHRERTQPGWTGYALVQEDEGEVPFDLRCSNYVQGCRIEACNGRHTGECSHIVLDSPRRASASKPRG